MNKKFPTIKVFKPPKEFECNSWNSISSELLVPQLQLTSSVIEIVWDVDEIGIPRLKVKLWLSLLNLTLVLGMQTVNFCGKID